VPSQMQQPTVHQFVCHGQGPFRYVPIVGRLEQVLINSRLFRVCLDLGYGLDGLEAWLVPSTYIW
jgi:hypothetical protein